MTKICFASYEIHPVTPGGCGVLLHNSARLLLQQGHQVTFLVDMPRESFERFDPSHYPNGHNCRAVLVEELCVDLPLSRGEFSNTYTWRAYRFHWAARKLAIQEQPDLIEFFDYNGVAHYALSAKLTQGVYENTCLAIRLHNSDELMNRQQPHSITADEYTIYALEHSALRLAEVVLYPSQAYLDKAYRPHHEPWLGQTLRSKPALTNFPKLRSTGQPKNKILFYGRLFGFKGVDLFIDAAVKVLSEGNATDLCFSLVGYDPGVAPDGSNSYQSYLLKRIPQHYYTQFEFLGQLSWEQLEELLPTVWCAVFPGYFESYCYAAHELYAAGIPIIVNNIPAFEDYFIHRKNALLFDGSVADLARQLSRLRQDSSLRDQMSYPYSVVDQPLDNFYENPWSASWIKPSNLLLQPLSSLVCILDEGSGRIQETLESVRSSNLARIQIVVLTRLSPRPEKNSNNILWFLGQLYRAGTPGGEPLSAVGLETAETLLILRGGDVLHQDYLPTCLALLARQPELAFAGAWKRIHCAGTVRLSTFPIDAALELIPFENLPLLSRAVMRTEPGKLLIDLFDPRLMQLGEVGYLWDCEAKVGPGVLVPECLMDVNEDDAPTWNATLLSYLVARDSAAYRKTRLSNYLLTYKTGQDETRPVEARYSEEILALVQTIGASKFGRLIGDNPFLVKWSKALLRRLRGGVRP